MESIYSAAESSSKDDVRLRTLLLTTHIDSRNTTGHTALMFASEKGGVHSVNTLIEKGADVNGKSNNGNTALMFASKRGHVAVIERLLKNGAVCTVKNNNGDCALTFAVSEGRVAAAEMLLCNGAAAEIDTKNNDGETALMMASRNGSHACIELLFNNHASDAITTNDGKTVYDLSKNKNTSEYLKRVVQEYHTRMATEEKQRLTQRNDELHTYITTVIHSASKKDLEACHRLELMEGYELIPQLKSLSAHLFSRAEYSTLDKRLMWALANPQVDQENSAKLLLDRIVNYGTIFPAEPAKRSDITLYRSTYKKSINSIVKEIERNNVGKETEYTTMATGNSSSSP